MKRTTLFIDERLERELRALARRRDLPMAAVVREAVERYVVSAREAAPRRPAFVAAGRSGRDDVAERHEELLFADAATEFPPAPARPRSARRAAGAAPRQRPARRG